MPAVVSTSRSSPARRAYSNVAGPESAGCRGQCANPATAHWRGLAQCPRPVSACACLSNRPAHPSSLSLFFPLCPPSFPLDPRSSSQDIQKSGEGASIFASCPRQPRQQNTVIGKTLLAWKTAFGESHRVPPTFRKKKTKNEALLWFHDDEPNNCSAPSFQETSRCCFAGHLRSFVSSLLCVIRVHCLPAGSPASLFPLSLLHALHFPKSHASTGRVSHPLPSSRRAFPRAPRVMCRAVNGALGQVAAQPSAARNAHDPIALGGILPSPFSRCHRCSGHRAVSQSDKIILLPPTHSLPLPPRV